MTTYSYELIEYLDAYEFGGYPYKEENPNLVINIDGYKWRVFGDIGLKDVMDDTSIKSKKSIFGFALSEET
jgi:hypothetical protein